MSDPLAEIRLLRDWRLYREAYAKARASGRMHDYSYAEAIKPKEDAPMAYDDTACPCGDKKPPSTMLCDACMAELADRREMQSFKNDQESPEWRRQAAIILLSLARGRKRRQTNEQSTVLYRG